MIPYRPGVNNCVPVAAGTTTAATQFANSTTIMHNIMISNAGSVDAFVAFGDSSITTSVPASYASQGGQHIPAGSVQVLSTPVGANYCAAITASGSTTLYIGRGDGF